MQNTLIDDYLIDRNQSFLLWINTSSEEPPAHQLRLGSVFDQLGQFPDPNQCEEYISRNVSKNNRIVLIIEEANICEDSLVRITKLPQVSGIYIQCSCKNSHNDSNNISFEQFDKVS